MTLFSRRRWLAQTSLAAAAMALRTLGGAQSPVKIRRQLDWSVDGQSAPLYYSLAKGYFEKEGLYVSFDVGAGWAMAVNRLASGSYDMVYAV